MIDNSEKMLSLANSFLLQDPDDRFLDPETANVKIEVQHTSDYNVHDVYKSDQTKSSQFDNWNFRSNFSSVKEEKSIKNSSQLIQCSFCSETFSYQTQLIFHHEHTHADKLHFACSMCKQKFAVISLLSEHVLKHNIQSIFKCSKCSKSFTTPISLVKHKCNTALISSKMISYNDLNQSLPSSSVDNNDQLQRHLKYQHLERDRLNGYPKLLPDQQVVNVENKVQTTLNPSDVQGNIFTDVFTENLNSKMSNSEFKTSNEFIEETDFKSMLLSEDKLKEHNQSCDLDLVRNDVSESRTSVSSDATVPWYSDSHSLDAFEHNSDKSFNSTNVNNNNNNRTYACSQCGEVFYTKAMFNAHKQVHTVEQLIRYTCSHCDNSFSLKRLLNRHIKMIHSNERKRTFQCTQCDKSFFNKQNLEHHKPTHSSERLTCTDCRKEFCGARALNRHKLIHTTQLNYVCLQCEKKFARSSDLSSHVLKQHRQIGPFVCSLCNKLFSVLSNLNAHNRRMHNEGVFLCMHCGVRYTTKASLNNHLVTHGDATHACTVCDKRFIRLHSLKYHMEQMHCDKKPSFLCPLCGKGFTKKSNLNYHILIHTGERRYACTSCDKRFTKPHDVKIHIRRVHGNQRPFDCTQCDKNFATKGQLKVHKMLHCSGEGYSCLQCNNTFPFLSALNRHIKQEHCSMHFSNLLNFVSPLNQ